MGWQCILSQRQCENIAESILGERVVDTCPVKYDKQWYVNYNIEQVGRALINQSNDCHHT